MDLIRRSIYIVISSVLCLLSATSIAAQTAPKGETGMAITQVHKAIVQEDEWLNTERALTAEDLAGRIILLDFWTYCCINCIHIVPDLQYLEEKFGHDLTVIGVHSAKFANERDTENIRQAVLRYGIEHAVVNDGDFNIWNRFGVRAWPTQVLIAPDGHIYRAYSGEGHRDEIEEDIKSLLREYDTVLNRTALPYNLEKHKQPPSMLQFPGKLAYADDRDTLFVSDSSHNRIVEMDRDGRIITVIGGKEEGFLDGDYTQARFNTPQGVLYHNQMLYVADTENHALRQIDLRKGVVSTLAGTGKQGHSRHVFNAVAKRTPLASPWDLAFYPDTSQIAIAMAGTHQLWRYDMNEKTVSVLAGNGREYIDDGVYPLNSLSQPSGFAVHDGKLYFVDSETSALRVLEGNRITTLIGTGLFDFGYNEGTKEHALLQHSLGVYADDSGVYIADAYNHAIRRYDPKTGYLHNFAGNGERGDASGALTQARFNEPNDIIKVGDTFYITDTNNHQIRVINNGTVSALNVVPEAMQSAPTFLEHIPNADKMDVIKSALDMEVVIDLTEGWKINEDAPTYLALFKVDGSTHEFIADYTREHVSAKKIMLPELEDGVHYQLQGILYYCEDKENSLCLIKGYDQALLASASSQVETITVELK